MGEYDSMTNPRNPPPVWLELRVPPVLVLVVTAGLMRWTARPLDRIPLGPEIEQTLALLFLATGIVVSLGALWSFHRSKTTVDPTRPNRASQLVTSGVFRLSRNPIYLGMVCLLVAWAFRLSSPPTILFVGLFALYMSRFQIVPEERALTERFQAEFDAYCQRTQRWL